MKLTSRQRLVGEMLPPWYYGLAYTDFIHDYEVFYPIPFNYVVRGCMRVRYFWNGMRSRPTWIDRQINAERNRIIGLEDKHYREKLREISKWVASALKSSPGELTAADFYPERAKEALGKIQEMMRWI